MNELQEKVHAILNLIKDSVFIMNIDGIIEQYFHSSNNADIFISSENFLNKHYKNVFPGYISKKFRTALNTIKKDGQAQQFEFITVNKNGQRTWYNVKISPIHENSDQLDKLTVVLGDVTESRNYKEIFENAVMGIYQSTVEGKHISANKALAEIYGYESPEELITRIADISKQLFVNQKRRNKFISELIQHDKLSNFESEVFRKDGTVIWISENARAVRDWDGRILYIIGTVKDITERKKAEEKLINHQKQLRSLASELSLLEERQRRQISTEIHDHIGQSLALCKIKLGALKKKAVSTPFSEPLHEINELIEKTIKSTRTLIFEISPPILYEMGFEAAVEWLSEQMQHRYNMTIYYENDQADKPMDNHIRILLFQAVRELLMNVAKHSEANHAWIALSRIHDKIQVIVKDDGKGFDVNSLSRQIGEKAGYGLFNIKERLNHLGEIFKLESIPGKGTTITLLASLKTTGS